MGNDRVTNKKNWAMIPYSTIFVIMRYYLGIFSKCLKIIKMVCVTSNLGLPYTYHFWYSYPFPSLKGMSFQRIRSRLPFYKYIVKKLSEYFFFSLPSKRHWKYVFQRKSIKSPFFDFWPSLWRVNNVVSEYRNFLPVWLPFPC